MGSESRNRFSGATVFLSDAREWPADRQRKRELLHSATQLETKLCQPSFHDN